MISKYATSVVVLVALLGLVAVTSPSRAEAGEAWSEPTQVRSGGSGLSTQVSVATDAGSAIPTWNAESQHPVTVLPNSFPWMPSQLMREWPSARLGPGMAYDGESDRIVLFGGQSGSALGDTWSYDFNSNTWTNMNPPSSPSARFEPGMAYDVQSDRIVLFGGAVDFAGNVLGGTWSYNVDTNTWTNMNPATEPSPRADFVMTYDAGSDRIILFGGFTFAGGTFIELNDTWSYDYDTNTWTQLNPERAPPPRHSHGMAYDVESDRIILLGGHIGGGCDSAVLYGDTWAYDNERDNWTALDPVGASAIANHHGMVYDSGADRVIYFGGEEGCLDLTNGTWEFNFNANTWRAMSPSTNPGNRWFHEMAYDAQSDRIVLFGGSRGAGGVLAGVDETWAYDYDMIAWIPLTRPTGPRNLAAVAGDGQIDLAWTEPSRTAGAVLTNYRIYRGTSTGGLTLLEEVGPVLTYADMAVMNGATYFYQVTAVTTAGEGLASQAVSATPMDATNPTITIISPTDGATIITPSVQVRGTASDNSGLEQVEVSLDGTTWNLAVGTTAWSTTLELDLGQNTIFARATDTSGNSATDSLIVTREVPPSGGAISPDLLVIGAVGAVVAAAVGVALFVRRKRGGRA